MGCQFYGNISFANSSRAGNNDKIFRGICQPGWWRIGIKKVQKLIYYQFKLFTTQVRWYNFRQFLPQVHHPESFCSVHPAWRLRQYLQEKKGN